jgi:hypothetical protein
MAQHARWIKRNPNNSSEMFIPVTADGANARVLLPREQNPVFSACLLARNFVLLLFEKSFHCWLLSIQRSTTLISQWFYYCNRFLVLTVLSRLRRYAFHHCSCEHCL